MYNDRDWTSNKVDDFDWFELLNEDLVGTSEPYVDVDWEEMIKKNIPENPTPIDPATVTIVPEPTLIKPPVAEPVGYNPSWREILNDEESWDDLVWEEMTPEEIAKHDELRKSARVKTPKATQAVNQMNDYFGLGDNSSSSRVLDDLLDEAIRMGKGDEFYEALGNSSKTDSRVIDEMLNKVIGDKKQAEQFSSRRPQTSSDGTKKATTIKEDVMYPLSKQGYWDGFGDRVIGQLREDFVESPQRVYKLWTDPQYALDFKNQATADFGKKVVQEAWDKGDYGKALKTAAKGISNTKLGATVLGVMGPLGDIAEVPLGLMAGESLGEAVTTAAGSTLGFAVGNAIVPFAGGIAGAIAGDWLAGKAYNMFAGDSKSSPNQSNYEDDVLNSIIAQSHPNRLTPESISDSELLDSVIAQSQYNQAQQREDEKNQAMLSLLQGSSPYSSSSFSF